jgi:outer membrane protein OmpA-like peptidoglycan-associated protein
MSDVAPQVRSTPILALVFLVLSFVAGLFLAYSRGNDIQPNPPGSIQSADVVESVAVIDWGAKLAAMDGQLTEARTGIQRIDEGLSILREQQRGIDSQLAEIADFIAQAGFGTTQSSPTAPQPQGSPLSRLEEDFERLSAVPTEWGRLVTFAESNLRFPPEQTDVPSDQVDALRPIADTLSRHGSLRAQVVGHTDRSGSASSNLELSRKRAESVKAALVALGADRDRIQTDGLGDTSPITDNETPEARQRNRRVEIYLIGP